MQTYGRILRLLALPVFLCTLHCARSALKTPEQAFRPAKAPEFIDEAQFETLKKGVEELVVYWQGRDPQQVLRFGSRTLTAADYLVGLRALSEQSGEAAKFFTHLQTQFDFFEVYGGERWGEVFITGYYEPLIEGSKKRTTKFSQALYRTPPDLVRVDLKSFFDVGQAPQNSLKGRLVAGQGTALPLIAPYHTRQDIDEALRLKGQKLEMVFVDPIEAFFLQTQGSGEIVIDQKSKLRVGYAEQNGHPYVPIGKFLKEVIPSGQMSLQAIETHMRSMSTEEQRALMNKNPSYVFFRELTGRALTSSGMEVVEGRTIATDAKFFPKGALALLEFQKPLGQGVEKIDTVKSYRVVFDQDVGGAIKGPGRVDLYTGKGPEAREMAGRMRHAGRLWYMVPKKMPEETKIAVGSL